MYAYILQTKATPFPADTTIKYYHGNKNNTSQKNAIVNVRKSGLNTTRHKTIPKHQR